MKITTNKPSPIPNTYKRGDSLKPNWIYKDADGSIVITSWMSEPIVSFDNNEVYGDTAISWPLHDTDVNTITIKR